MSMLPADAHRRLDPPCPACDDTGDITSLDGEWRGYCTICPAGGAPRHPAHHMVRARLMKGVPPPIAPATYPTYAEVRQAGAMIDLGAIVRGWARTPGALSHPDLRAQFLTESMPEEWRTEPATTSFAKSYNGEGSYYCPRCNSNQGSVWLHSDWRPTKWQALCSMCRRNMRGAGGLLGGQPETQDSHVDS